MMTSIRRSLDRSRQAGFSIIEVVIASLVLLFIALGLIPMFTTAIGSNVQGHDSTRVANMARQRLEQALSVGFDHPLLDITAGTQVLTCDWFELDTDVWTIFDCSTFDSPPAGSDYLRRVTVEQYQMSAFTDEMAKADPDLASIALDATASPSIVHIKQIIVEVENTRQGGVFGAGKGVTVRTFKSL